MKNQEKAVHNLETGYRINEQGMIVEEIDEPDIKELTEKINPQYTHERVIFMPENFITAY